MPSLLDRIFGTGWTRNLAAEQPRWPKGDPRGGQWKATGVARQSSAVSKKEIYWRDNGAWRKTPLYHQTTEDRWLSIKKEGLIPGGHTNTLRDEYERYQAGANFSPDSAHDVALAYMTDGRYGSVTLRIDPTQLKPELISAYSKDLWDPSHERVSFEKWHETIVNAFKGDITAQDDFDEMEIRYAGKIPPGAIKRVYPKR